MHELIPIYDLTRNLQPALAPSHTDYIYFYASPKFDCCEQKCKAYQPHVMLVVIIFQ